MPTKCLDCKHTFHSVDFIYHICDQVRDLPKPPPFDPEKFFKRLFG